MNFMKHKGNHLNHEELIDYFYQESPNPQEIKEHIRTCRRCREQYDELKRNMESLSEHFRHDFWRTQRKMILSRVKRAPDAKGISWAKWLVRPAFVTIMLLVLFVAIYSRLNHAPFRYTEKDRSDEILLEHVAELIDQPITSSLDYLDFQEENAADQDTEFDYSSDKLEIFGFWPELGA